MQSPFPGMDPYLERHWGDVHHSIITFARGMLNEQLPGDLRARVEERIVDDLPSHDEHAYYADVRVVQREHLAHGAVAVAVSEATLAEPLEVPLGEPETQGYIEILQTRPERRVITVIEVLSPSNKYAGKGRRLYEEKQRDLDAAEVNMVEIDLLRAGPHVMLLPLVQYPPAYRTPYKVCVHRAGKAKVEIYRVPLRERLPAIRIPLRNTDPDVRLDLQALIGQVYRQGRYDDIDYTVPPVPPLDDDDAAWADELLRAASKRPATVYRRLTLPARMEKHAERAGSVSDGRPSLYASGSYGATRGNALWVHRLHHPLGDRVRGAPTCGARSLAPIANYGGKVQ